MLRICLKAKNKREYFYNYSSIQFFFYLIHKLLHINDREGFVLVLFEYSQSFQS